MGAIDLTVKGSSRIVTDRTLDREGFYIPEPPQRYNPRAKSAIGLGKRECQRPNLTTDRIQSPRQSITIDRPKSAFVPNQIRSKKPDFTFKHASKATQPNNLEGNEKEIKSEKCDPKSNNQKWVYPTDETQWRRRKSYVPKKSTQNRNDIKQRISVCEVMAKMRSNSPESKGSSAPPCSPKSNDGQSILGRKFTEIRPQSAPEPVIAYPNYMTYARSKTQKTVSNKSRQKYSFLQEDTSITAEPSKQIPSEAPQEVIEIPTMEMFTTDEPDEESAVIDESRKYPTTNAPRPTSNYQNHLSRSKNKRQLQYRVENTNKAQEQLYRQVYYDHSAVNHRGSQKLKPDHPDVNHVRYNPVAFRFQHKQWDKKQPRPKSNDINRVFHRRPNISQSLYVGVS